MSDTNTTRRNGRDRRDAGRYRSIRLADRERDLARSEARELKGRGLAWNGVGAAAPTRTPVPTPFGFDPKRSVKAVGDRSASDVRGATPPLRPVETTTAPIERATPSTDRSWLPEVGTPVVVAGSRIVAIEVAGGRDRPFYVLVRAD